MTELIILFGIPSALAFVLCVLHVIAEALGVFDD